MEQKDLSIWLKGILAGLGICGLAVYFFIIPSYGRDAVASNPEFSFCYWPWLIFLWVTAIPIYIALVLGWKIAMNIGADRSFCLENAEYLKWIAWLAAGDVGYFFIGNIVLLFLNMNHPGIVLLSLVVVFIGIAICVASTALSKLTSRAADIEDENRYTI